LLSGKIFYRRFPFAFVSRREIKSPEELRGKRLAISRFGSSSDVTTRMLVKYWNLDPEKGCADFAGRRHDTAAGDHQRPNRRHTRRHLRRSADSGIRMLPKSKITSAKDAMDTS
jgi:hypothetical protein